MSKGQCEQKKERSFAQINTRSFIFVTVLLLAILLVTGALSYFIPQGSFDRGEDGSLIDGTYVAGEVDGIPFWRVLTAPVRVFFAPGCITIIMISVFLLIMSGVFNLVEKTHGVHIFMQRIVKRFAHRKKLVCCLCVLAFMLFGSFFGMFEELVTLLPIIIIFMLSINMDTMMGLGACLLAACFGFSAAITNPFSVGLAAQVAGVNPSSGVWLRIVFFGITYVTLCAFLMLHLRKIEKNPAASPSYAVDLEKRAAMTKETELASEDEPKIFTVYSIFLGLQFVILILIASVRAIADYAIPILALSFLIFGTIAGLIVCRRPSTVARHVASGAASMLPAVLMIALASSVKLVMTESRILDTIMNTVINFLDGKNKFLAIVLIYVLILFFQFFIGSASAKIILIMPLIMPIATSLGLSPSIVILAYCMADGFTDVILPTNPVLLIGLSMANVSYGTWVKWTWKLQLFVLTLTMLVLLFAVGINY